MTKNKKAVNTNKNKPKNNKVKSKSKANSKNKVITKSKKKKKGKRRLKKAIKIKLILIAIITSIILCVVLFMFNSGNFISMLKQQKISEEIIFDSVDDISVFNEIIGEFQQNRPAIKREIKYIVMHETGNFTSSANASNHSNYLLTNTTDENSWHYTVDENVIYHHLPDNEVGWHAGDGLNVDGGNLNGIGIELCVNEGSDYLKTVDNAAKLVAKLLDLYDLDIEDIKTHKDFSGKDCPTNLLLDNNWEIFIVKIVEHMQ